MTEVNKLKLQLRSGLSSNGDKTPPPATKLLINHGKPNFTIQQRSPKAQNGNASLLSPTPKPVASNNNNNGFLVKSTTFNGVFMPSSINGAANKQTLLQHNGNTTISSSNATDNEAAKVVLRRAQVVQSDMREDEDDKNVPEFIRRQRRIQQRLANQNILDFENRRSGYFTQVLISPSSPNRQSFVETMASPAIKPGLEIPPPPTTTAQNDDIMEETTQEEPEEQTNVEKSEETVVYADTVTVNGQDEKEDEEEEGEEEAVAKAIEEVNKAVEGEDEDKMELEEYVQNVSLDTEHDIKPTVVAVTAGEHVKLEEEKSQEQFESTVAVGSPLAAEEETTKKREEVESETQKLTAEPVAIQNDHVEVVCEKAPTNGILAEDECVQNGQAINGDDEITISHTNGLNGPTLPSPDPKGEKGVNFKPTTVVSFSQELGNDVNRYPDTVKVVKEVEASTVAVDHELEELTKLKFEIKADHNNIEVKPVLITDTA